MQAEQKHPADELAKTLARANGILTLLSGCYERESGTFATSMSYIHESIVAVESILSKATEAMARLYQQCDLSLVRQMQEATVEDVQRLGPEETVDLLPGEEIVAVAEQAFEPAASTATQPTQLTGAYLGHFGPQETSGRLSERFDDLLQRPTTRSLAASADVVVRPAQTYDELLAKITAVADKAAYRAHHGQGEPSLAPELEALRADLIKLRAVA